MQPPVYAHYFARSVSDDFSAAVRIHRAGRSLDVLALTPESEHWDAAFARVPPLHAQFASAQWRPGAGRARFERLSLAAMRPRLPLKVGAA